MKNFGCLLTHAVDKWNVPSMALVLLLLSLASCSPLLAQSGAGAIQGVVTDSTGAVIPGASIHVVQQNTNATFDTKSNQVGFYQVPELFAGPYGVTVIVPGMKSYKAALELLVAQTAIVNPVLSAGDVTEHVEVSANAIQLTTTDNGTIAATLENQKISQLPMNGRVVTSLTGMTTPGLEGGQRANGLMAEGLEYVADGVPLTNRQFGGENDAQALLPDPDSVQEVRVETSGTGAQFTEPGTAIITTKSGTNTLHGALFETARNNAIGIARARQNPSNFAAPHYVRNEFGASAGGPIVLPHVYHGKDKSFWFFAYEKYSLASSGNELVTVPTVAMRGGDYSGLINSAGNLQQLYDPATTASSANCPATQASNPYCRTPFPNNQIPIGRLAPTSKVIFDISPLPSTADNPLINPNLSAVDPNNQFIPSFTFRLDHTFNENNRAYLRYQSNVSSQNTLRNYPSNSPASIAADGMPANASGVAYNPSSTFAPSLGYTHVFSPTFYSETILSNQWFGQHNYAGGTPTADFESKLGLPNNFGEAGFPNYGSNLILPFGGTMFVYGVSQIITNLDENLTKTVGRHQMQFGGRYRHERFGFLPNQLSDYVNFTALTSGLYDPSTGANYGALPNTGNVNGDMFLGSAGSYQVSLEPPYEHFHDMEFDAYFQDNFHVNKNFTLNLGLRYEAHPAPWVKYGIMQSFDLKNDAMVLATSPSNLIAEGFTTQAIVTNMLNIGAKFETPAQAGLPDKLLYDYNLTFSPRVGIAYLPFGGKYGTVIRGGYGRYIYPVTVYASVKQASGNTPESASYTQNFNAANQSPDGVANYLLRHPQSVVMGVNSANVVDTTSTNSILPGLAPYAMDPLIPPDFVTETNLTVEQPMKGNSVLRVSWVWTHGTNLDQEYFPNLHPSTYAWELKTGTPLPTGSVIGSNQYAATATGPYDQTTWGSIIWDQKSGWSNDNALQVNYQRLYHRGIAYQAFYVWSRPFRVGGNYFRDGLIDPNSAFVSSGVATMSMVQGSSALTAPALPPAPPAGSAPYAYYRSLNSYQNYHLDSAIPLHHVQFNGIVDLPFGRGKKFMGNTSRLLDEIVGGFQLAGDGSVISQDFQPAASNWGPSNPLQVYKHRQKITDCRSGVCHPEYLWFNGYFSPKVINASSKGVSGLPSGYQANQVTSPAYSSPLDNDVTTTQFGTNNVQLSSPALLASNKGNPVTVAYSPGPQGTNPFSKTFLNGPFNYSIDLSLFKVFSITERVKLRLNVDAFNALNMQGYNNPNTTDGTEAIVPGGQGASSYFAARQLQFTLRLQF